jgi:cytochrome c oxidase assembly protein subunit 15
MPFDVRDVSDLRPGDKAADPRSRHMVAAWLFGVAGMILIMVVIGGVTRLTGSGLSIMEWAPISGVLPPLTAAAWQKLFDLYKQVPQYALVNQGFGLAGFRQIFWLEWIHRLWGRLIGVAFLGPLVWLWSSGRIEGRLRPRLALLFVLGGLQGAVGWFMVASGFLPDTTAVSAYRLVIHLVLALALYAAIVWIGLGVLRPVPASPILPGVPILSESRSFGLPIGPLTEPVVAARWMRRLATLLFVLVALTIIAGGFVAGTRAGFDYNSFPLMAGHLVPTGYARLSPFIRNLTENIAAVQFDHRVLATLTALVSATIVTIGVSTPSLRPVRRMVLLLASAVAVQYVLGVTTLLLVDPVGLAAAHQAVAVLVLTAALAMLHALRGAA